MITELLVIIIWAMLSIYGAWYLFDAKTYEPLNIDNLALQWKIHKQKSKCNAKILNGMIKRNDQIVGFKCECGYEYFQKRLITQRPNQQKMEAKKCS